VGIQARRRGIDREVALGRAACSLQRRGSRSSRVMAQGVGGAVPWGSGTPAQAAPIPR
jgi:hypothetical protein